MARVGSRGLYVVLAGSAGDQKGGARAMLWSGVAGEKPTAVLPLEGNDLNPEAAAVHADGRRVLILSDDGGLLFGGAPCKSLSDPQARRFRALELILQSDRK